ncbi:hypothetical protein SETIT_6G170800v2 [Setaria italica]|uniref:UDP-glycosyltransferases domain-containing protein n=1 Tax=Setaria italica TaxID=4555 RepID=A0A368RMH6_SETIT|nr:hypothetical protein SETIT_6G170800v2 [Setaria italica]
MEEVQERTVVRPCPRVLLVCSSCTGHLIPFAELSRCLVADHSLAATLLFAAATSPPPAQYLSLAASALDSRDTHADRDHPDLSWRAFWPDRDRVGSSLPDSAVWGGVFALAVTDMIGTPALVVMVELGVPSYVFFTSPWMALSLFLRLPELDILCFGEHHDATESIFLLGYTSIHAHELLSESYVGMLSMAEEFRGVDNILVNTFRDLEPAVGDSLEGLEVLVHPVGPLVLTRSVSMDWDHESLRPDQDTSSGSFFGATQGEETSMDFLPKGFIERTKGIGLMIQAWVPQSSILAHTSVGCFITHSGWNSSLEKQHMNASMLEVQVWVATVGPNRFTSKEEVATAIHHGMEGEESKKMMKRASELKEKSEHALSKVGCSTQALAQITDTWKQVAGANGGNR